MKDPGPRELYLFWLVVFEPWDLESRWQCDGRLTHGYVCLTQKIPTSNHFPPPPEPLKKTSKKKKKKKKKKKNFINVNWPVQDSSFSKSAPIFFFYTRKHFGIWQIWQLPITFNIYICLIPHSQYSPKLRLFFFLHLSLVEIIWFGWFSSGNWIIKIHAYSLNLILANSFCHSSSSSEHKKKKVCWFECQLILHFSST